MNAGMVNFEAPTTMCNHLPASDFAVSTSTEVWHVTVDYCVGCGVRGMLFMLVNHCRNHIPVRIRNIFTPLTRAERSNKNI